MQYVFIFGNTPKLSLAELSSVVKGLGYQKAFQKDQPSGKQGIAVDLPEEVDIRKLFNVLGGTVKIGKVIGQGNSDEEILKILLNQYSSRERVTFGLSYYGSKFSLANLIQLSKDLKNSLGPEKKVRYVLPREGLVLSPVVVTKQKVTETIFLETEGILVIAETLAVSDFENWNKRDYGRPGVDAHSGMLPPRIARMMVNIGLTENGGTILDPFCGVGTVLMEGLMVGCEVKGMDLSQKHVDLAKRNLEWLGKNYQLSRSDFRLILADARKVSEGLNQKVDAIVTEPDLGPNVTNMNYDLRIMNRLRTLYLECLEEWKKVLKPGGRVVIVVPSFVEHENRVNTDLVKNIVDKAVVMGYSLEQDPIEYFRPQARVRRNICIFELKV